MSEETKEPLEETPVTAEAAETEQEKTPENQEPEKKAKKKEKKEKGITFTREQVEKDGAGCQAAGIREGSVHPPHCRV